MDVHRFFDFEGNQVEAVRERAADGYEANETAGERVAVAIDKGQVFALCGCEWCGTINATAETVGSVSAERLARALSVPAADVQPGSLWNPSEDVIAGVRALLEPDGA